MRFVAPPTHVGEDQWPVLSAVRVDTADDPAQFVVLVDCGGGTPQHPYATLQVFVWQGRRTRRKVTDGEYNLTFEQARRSLAERAGLLPTTTTTTTTVEVVVVRDPDDANNYAIFVDGTRRPDGSADGVRVVTHDIDLGAVQITPASVEQQLRRADALSPAAARHARDAVIAHVDDIEVDDEHAGGRFHGVRLAVAVSAPVVGSRRRFMVYLSLSVRALSAPRWGTVGQRAPPGIARR